MIKVTYELADLNGNAIDVQEDRGRITIQIGNHLTPEEIVSALNEASKAILAGGHWFQEWKGDIVSIDSPETASGPAIPPQRPSLYDVNKPQSGAA